MCLKMDVPGMGTAIICGRGRERAKPCKFCLANGGRKIPSTKLCDFPLGKGTCDAPICDRHATAIGPDLDHCPVHSQQARLFPTEVA
jgi:hypothetical protein